jgi:3-keto-5-aminohexanoate cleavage enzyme
MTAQEIDGRYRSSAAGVIKLQAAPPSPSVAIAVAPNGGRRTKADHPAIPLTPDELARTAAACLEAGAAMIHAHVRDSDGRHLLDAEAYRAAIAAIRGAVGERLVIQISSEALGLYSPAEQSAIVRQVKPEAVSLALRELAPRAGEEAAFADLLLWLKQQRVIPQIILYSPGEAVRLAQLQKQGVVPWDDIPVLYALGRYARDETASPSDLLPFLAPGAPRARHWMACAFGRHETACVVAAALMGGHVRVGFENNLFLPNGVIAPANRDLVVAARVALEACGRRASTADELRGMMVA